MKRRVMLFAGTLVVLLLAFAAYQFVAGGAGCWSVEEQPVPRRAADRSGPVHSRPVDEGLSFYPRDQEGRLEGIYRARRWEKRSANRYLLFEPSVRMFRKNGQVLVIRADRGTVYAEEMTSDVNIRRGSLEGNVEILFDRSTDANAGPMEDRPEDVVRFYVDYIKFDNDRLQMTTGSEVTVFSREADIFGKGLTIQWNEDPDELRLVRIDQGEYMAVKAAGGAFDTVSLSPAEAGPAEQAGAGAPPALEEVEEIPPLAIESPSAAQPATRPATAATAPVATAPARPPRRNIFRATFHRQVRVISDSRQLDGADRLSLLFEWDRDRSDVLSVRRRPASPAEADAADLPGARPETRPAEQARQDQEPSKVMHIFWHGPLVLTPEGYTASPSVERFRIEAEGDGLALADSQSRAICRSFIYQQPARAGQLSGGEGQPVRLELGGEGEALCREIRFDSRRGLAQLYGPGVMSAAAAEKAAATQPSTETIAWRDVATARFGSVEVIGEDGTARSEPFVSEVVFVGGVELSGAQADFVKSQRLHVWLARGRRGQYPTKAIATGNVSARRRGSDVRADEITVNFAEQPGRGRRAFKETSVVATGNVRMTDKRGDQVTTATAAKMTVFTDDPDDRRAVLEGSPARIVQGRNMIAGRELHLREAQQAAESVGSGSLAFMNDRDFEGGKLDRPEPVNIAWSGAMRFSGKENWAEFADGVKLVSGPNSIRCREMRVTFRAKPGSGPAPAEPAEAEQGGRLAFDVERLGRRQLATVRAKGNVVVLSRRKDRQGKLTQELLLKAERLFYDAEARRIRCSGAGTLLIEDYRPPERGKARPAAGRSDFSRDVERPWQTAFQWRREMQLLLSQRLVVMKGEVFMRHLSGSHILHLEKLRRLVPDWGRLPEGRTTHLSCGDLIVQFAEPEAPAARKALDEPARFDPGRRVGPLDLFRATDDVVLRDGDWELQGRQLTYQRSQGLAILYGYLDGQTPANASVMDRGRPIRSPKFHCYLDDKGHVQQVVAIRVTGAGTR